MGLAPNLNFFLYTKTVYGAGVKLLLKQVTDPVKKDMKRTKTAAFNTAVAEAVVVLAVDDRDKV